MSNRHNTCYALFAAALLLVVFFLRRSIYFCLPTADYVVIHFIIESLSVFMSLGIATTIYHDHNGACDNTGSFLAASFVAVALLDFFHLASYPGMPNFITANSPEKAILFWLAARFTFALAMIIYLVFSKLQKYFAPGVKTLSLLSGVGYALGLMGMILIWPNSFPEMFISGAGTTFYKQTVEVLVVVMLLLPFSLAFWNGNRYSLLFLGLGLSIGSEVALAIYISPYDSLNLWGHILRLCANSFIFSHFVTRSIKGPFRQVEEMFEVAIDHFAQYMDGRHKFDWVRDHSRRVAVYARKIAEELNLDCAETAQLYRAALMHDVGKIAIPYRVLKKRESFEQDEWEYIRKHPEIAVKILGARGGDCCLRGVLEHHERLDGSGFPAGLKGDQISIYGRILAVADSFDALTSDWPDRPKLTTTSALERLMAETDQKLDRECVSSLVTVCHRGAVDI